MYFSYVENISHADVQIAFFSANLTAELFSPRKVPEEESAAAPAIVAFPSEEDEEEGSRELDDTSDLWDRRNRFEVTGGPGDGRAVSVSTFF